MVTAKWLPVPTKRQCGLAYLICAALALAVGLLGAALFDHGSVLVVFISGTTALAIVATTAYLVWIIHSVDVDDELAWDVARWTAVGLGVATLVSYGVGVGRQFFAGGTVLPYLLVLTIVAGGLIGALLGVVSSLRSQQSRLREVTQHNTVLNRVLRHNIKNDMNVILGHTALLREASMDVRPESLNAIERAANESIRLGTVARSVDRLMSGPERRQLDVAETIEDSLSATREKFPEATFSADLADGASVKVTPVLRPVVMNLLDNAVEHNNGDPSVAVSVRTVEDSVRVTVADNGPGIAEEELAVLGSDGEGPIRHGSGLGLWLVKWFADRNDGELRFDENEPRGTAVTLELPAIDG